MSPVIDGAWRCIQCSNFGENIFKCGFAFLNRQARRC
jgi:hypothetical protein